MIGRWVQQTSICVGLGGVLLTPRTGSAQVVDVYPVPPAARARITAANIVIGAAVGGMRAWSSNRPVRRAVLLGAGGGLTTALGRQITATGGWPAGFVGRVVHDVGLGLGSAAVDSHFTVPVHFGPLVARWTPAARRWPLVRVNATNLLYATMLASQANTKIDWEATLWSGAVTLQSLYSFDGGVDRASAAPGTIRMRTGSSRCVPTSSGARRCRLELAHETVHIQQMDMLHDWIGQPIEDAVIMRRLRRHRVFRHVELGAVGPLSIAGIERLRRYDTRWSEYEASWLTAGRGAIPEPRLQAK
ncbi:MAG: hypothetical protein IT355_11320 [Gemmatimonadaceae bacterium]|nr:hypothetical protein [Gemmatimonadaceae bacterium]